MLQEKRDKNQVYNDVPWFRIDNAATLYAAARNRRWCRTYRTCMVLDHDVDPVLLQQALDETAKRLPTFCVLLRDGAFWSYFERTDELPKLCQDTKYPYRPIQLDHTNQPCFRISYYKHRVAIEAFHSVSDGGGSDVFFNTLLARYLELKFGVPVPKGNGILDVHDKPRQCEAEDSYYVHADPTIKASNPPAAKVYLDENMQIRNYARIIHGLFRVEEISALSKSKGLTVTEYLVALLIFTYCSCAKEPIKDPISISVPIDLRKRFESQSVRNFVYMTDVSFDPQGRTDVTFEEICNSIKGKLKKKASREFLVKSISSNVSAASSPVLKPVPYAIKKAFLKLKYRSTQRSYTAFFTNLGVLSYPEEMGKHILRGESCMADSPYLHFGCSAVSVNGLFNFTFTSSNDNMEKQRFFFRFLANEGIKIRIESNEYE